MIGQSRLVIASILGHQMEWRESGFRFVEALLGRCEHRVVVRVTDNAVRRPAIQDELTGYGPSYVHPSHTNIIEFKNISDEQLSRMFNASYVVQLILGVCDLQNLGPGAHPSMCAVVGLVESIPAFSKEPIRFQECSLHFGYHRCEGESADGSSFWSVESTRSVQFGFLGVARALYDARDRLFTSRDVVQIADLIGPGIANTAMEFVQEL